MKQRASTEFEARALRELMAGRQKRAFAQQHKLPGGESMLSQHMHERRPVSMEAAVIYAEAFGVTLDRISPTWAALARRASALVESAKTGDAAGSLQAREQLPARYCSAPEWPFKRLTASEWQSLPSSQRELIESTALQFAGQQPNATRRAVA